MTPEELVEQVNKAMPGKLCSAVLYGSAAAGDFVPGMSNYNVLLVVDGLGVAELDALSKPVAQWTKAGHRPPLLFTRGQLQASADVFPIELLDMRQSHRVLFGEDPLADVTIKPRAPASASGTGTERKTADAARRISAYRRQAQARVRLLTSSVAGFLVLFRAALRLFQEKVPAVKIDALRLLAKHIPFDPQPLLDVHDLKHRRRKAGSRRPRRFSNRT